MSDRPAAGGPHAQTGAQPRAQVQLRAVEYPTHAPLGQFQTPTALGRKATGLLPSPAMALWNVEKK